MRLEFVYHPSCGRARFYPYGAYTEGLMRIFGRKCLERWMLEAVASDPNIEIVVFDEGLSPMPDWRERTEVKQNKGVSE